MDNTEREAIAVIALEAALVDGTKSEAERAEVKEIFGNLELSNPSSLMQQVLLKKASWEKAVTLLSSPEARQLAFEMAVCVCEADGSRNPAETHFLKTLSTHLRLGEASVTPVLAQADLIAHAAPLPAAYRQTLAQAQALALNPEPSSPLLPVPSSVSGPIPVTGEVTSLGVAAMPENSIRNTAILAGALELLPQSMATLAILPVQTHLVYRVGQHYGYKLDGSHVKEFLAVGGLGLASQALEGLARKFLGGLAKQAGGKLIGGLISTATGPAMTFATTYAMGKLADQYYSQNRQLNLDQLRTLFQSFLGQAQNLGQSLLPQIQSRARSLSPFDLAKVAQGTLVK
jgi:uncharacterized protein (DUF697 family)/tellurite resistance protein